MSQLNINIENALLTIEHYKGSMPDFRHAVVQGKYHKCAFFSRALTWKACLLTDSLHTAAWAERLRNSRLVFRELRLCHVPPWSTLDPDSDLHMPPKAKSRRMAHLDRVEISHDPLSADPSAPSAPSDPSDSSASAVSGESDAELLRSVEMDVQRLFPGDALFHNRTPQALRRKRHVATMLYVWARCNPHVGYKQGMHELLGLLYVNMATEAVDMPPSADASFSAPDRAVLSLFDAHYLQHDVFALFNRFVGASGVVAQFYHAETQLMQLIASFDALLMKVDQLVHYNLVTKLRLEPQLWIIRYLRLLLLRELGADMAPVLVLWDRLMAADLLLPAGLMCLPTLILFVVIVLLVRIKAELMVCDFAEALTLLLRYPIAQKTDADPRFLDSLFLDANDLYQNRANDLKLYERGVRLAKRAGTGLPVLYLRPGTPVLSPRLSAESTTPTAEATRAANMAFEKTRLEMRLKKKAQLMVRPS